MSDVQTVPNSFPWPPVIYGAAILVAVLLGWLVPLPWIGQPLSDILFAVGCLAVVAALAIIIVSIRTLRRHGTTEMPHRASEHLVTAGPFGLTRNPIYLGDTLLMIGMGLAAGIWSGRSCAVSGSASPSPRFARSSRCTGSRRARWGSSS